MCDWKTFCGLLFVLATSFPSAFAAELGEEFSKAEDFYRQGQYEKALEVVTPLLESEELADEAKTKAGRYAAACHHAMGDDFFRAGKMDKCIASYNAELKLLPANEPHHWQRGIAYYYAKRYQDGVDQFELHQTVNSQDVENAVWHLLCAVGTPGGSVEKAREKYIPIERDSRVPMAEVHEMFGGLLSPADVLSRAKSADTLQAQFYADLYVGLYYEAIGDAEQSAKHIAAAADNASAQRHFMGDVARVHRLIRKREAAGKSEDGTK